MRRTVRARAIAPIRVGGRADRISAWAPLRDQDSGEYLVEAIGDTPGGSSHLLASLAEANCSVVVPAEAAEIPAGTSSTSPSPSGAEPSWGGPA